VSSILAGMGALTQSDDIDTSCDADVTLSLPPPKPSEPKVSKPALHIAAMHPTSAVTPPPAPYTLPHVVTSPPTTLLAITSHQTSASSSSSSSVHTVDATAADPSAALSFPPGGVSVLPVTTGGVIDVADTTASTAASVAPHVSSDDPTSIVPDNMGMARQMKTRASPQPLTRLHGPFLDQSYVCI
jgi:hypothetical protein